MKLYALASLFGLFSMALNAQQAIDTAFYESELTRIWKARLKTSEVKKFTVAYQQLKERALSEDYTMGVLQAELGIAGTYYDIDDCDKVIQIADSVRKIAIDLELKKVQADAIIKMGRCLLNMNQLFMASTELQQAEKIYRQLSDIEGLEYINNLLGRIYYDLGYYEESKNFDFKAMQLAQELGNQDYYIQNYYNYANTLIQMGRCNEALPLLDDITNELEVLEIPQTIRHLVYIQEARLECKPSKKSSLDSIYKNLVFIEKNKEKYNSGNIFGERNFYTILYSGFVEYFLITRNPKKARVYIEKIVPWLKGNEEKEIDFLLYKSKYYELIGNTDSSLVFYKRYEQKKIEILRNKERLKVHQLNLRYEREKKDNEIAAQNLKLELLEEQAKKQRLYLLFFFGAVLTLSLGLFVINLKRKNRLLKRAEAEAMQGIKTKSLFLDTITHELRTPLSTILGSAYLLEGEKNDESRNGLIKAIRFSSEYLNKLIENTILLKTLGGPQPIKKSKKPSLERFNCRELVEGMRGTLVHSKNNNRLEIRIDKNIPNFVIGPELDLSRILVNLLSNSDKFTRNGLIKIIVQKSVTTLEDHIALTFTVSDNGSGIKDEEKEKVFDAFYSGKEHKTKQYTGMGLGLNLVKGLLEKHGAEPRLESRFGIGTSISFTMEFGIHKEQDVQTPLQVPKNEKARQRILLVEDNEVNQDMIKRIIEGLGYHCDVADNGKIALKKYKALPYSLVLMDMMMPVMDGFEATLLIKEFDPKAIIVALTAVSKEKYKDIFEELNLAAVISKPADASTLRSVLEQQLHPEKKTVLSSKL